MLLLHTVIVILNAQYLEMNEYCILLLSLSSSLKQHLEMW